MADRRKPKQKRKQNEPEKPTKEEYAVGKFLRFNVAIKEGKLMGMTVQCFKANKAVDALLQSKWAKQKQPLFTTRAGCVDYCHNLLEKGLFHRAAKVERKKERDRDKKKKKKEGEEGTPAAEKRKKKSKEKEDDEEKKAEAKEEEEKKEEEKKEEDKKKKRERKLRLEMHENQVFKDGDEVYVWIYDPVPFKTFVIGLLLVLGAIGVCLFPLWPPEVRIGVYYLSLAAGGFVIVILALCVIRMLLFCAVWAATMGKHHFWFLPNLTEDVGFFDSFKPLYKHESKLEQKDKAVEEEAEEVVEKVESPVEEQEEEKESKESESREKDRDMKKVIGEKDESGSEVSQENDNGYEIVDADDIYKEEVDDDDEEEDQLDDEGEASESDENSEPKKTK